MRSHLYGEQTGPSQAAGGSANGLTAMLGGWKFLGDRADMEGKSCDGHEVGLLVGESDRGYGKGGKTEGGAEVVIDELCTYVAEKASEGGYGWVWIGRGGRCWILWWGPAAKRREAA